MKNDKTPHNEQMVVEMTNVLYSVRYTACNQDQHIYNTFRIFL